MMSDTIKEAFWIALLFVCMPLSCMSYCAGQGYGPASTNSDRNEYWEQKFVLLEGEAKRKDKLLKEAEDKFNQLYESMYDYRSLLSVTEAYREGRAGKRSEALMTIGNWLNARNVRMVLGERPRHVGSTTKAVLIQTKSFYYWSEEFQSWGYKIHGVVELKNSKLQENSYIFYVQHDAVTCENCSFLEIL